MTRGSETSLGPLTTFGVGGPAEALERPETPEEAAEIVTRARGEGYELRVLGAGSNVLVADEGVGGTVLLLTAPPFKHLARVGSDTVQAGAGARLSRLVAAAADWGFAGAEALAGVPGTVGGALRMNAGGRDGEIAPLVKKVWTLDAEGKAETVAAADCGFAYRESALAERVVLGAELVFRRGEPGEIREGTASLLARRRETQPLGARTAGSVFKNPGEAAGSEGRENLSAGKLLDEIGLKGLARGGARVSPVHANFIEAREARPAGSSGEGATAADIKWLIDEMRRRAREERGVELELEIDLWGFEP